MRYICIVFFKYLCCQENLPKKIDEILALLPGESDEDEDWWDFSSVCDVHLSCCNCVNT